MPTSYQSPMRQDQQGQNTKSQSVELYDHNATVADLLDGKGRDVFSIKPEDTLKDAVVELRDRRVGALIVTDDSGALVGILSERDIVRKLADSPGQTLPQSVGSVMTKKVKVCGPSDLAIDVLKRMTEGRFRHLPVIENDQLIGMVTIGDAIHHRLTQLEHEALQMKQLIVG
ncbi:inosine-5-monophosphate dehydrogenase [Amylibacter marinus]|uniref:Inosine-5-monophosphate dehydrogenase n=1 Tax=Amylibacter marinus TaxID=1475483 RepID=A0ABQ5VS58_9RHOB|nr:CBS domain-containing protein [Amylibacter marinus]GLQ34164.1 inosine-5-monophosphate dehydrogenase [Amylibacter marinus]